MAQFLGSSASRPMLTALGVAATAPRYTSLELVNFGALKPAVVAGDTRDLAIRIGNHEGVDRRYRLAATVTTAGGRVISRVPFVQVPISAGATTLSRINVALPLCHGRVKVTAYLYGRDEKVHVWFAAAARGRQRTRDCAEA